MNDYDEEFGPNKRKLCECCNKPLMTDEICFKAPDNRGGIDEE